jgi:hypothetical protein
VQYRRFAVQRLLFWIGGCCDFMWKCVRVFVRFFVEETRCCTSKVVQNVPRAILRTLRRFVRTSQKFSVLFGPKILFSDITWTINWDTFWQKKTNRKSDDQVSSRVWWTTCRVAKKYFGNKIWLSIFFLQTCRAKFAHVRSRRSRPKVRGAKMLCNLCKIRSYGALTGTFVDLCMVQRNRVVTVFSVQNAEEAICDRTVGSALKKCEKRLKTVQNTSAFSVRNWGKRSWHFGHTVWKNQMSDVCRVWKQRLHSASTAFWHAIGGRLTGSGFGNYRFCVHMAYELSRVLGTKVWSVAKCDVFLVQNAQRAKRRGTVASDNGIIKKRPR